MKNVFLKISSFLIATMGLVGNIYGKDTVHQKVPQDSTEISEETLLYLDEAVQVTKSNEATKPCVWHTSHTSHGSHASHVSHASHYSGR